MLFSAYSSDIVEPFFNSAILFERFLVYSNIIKIIFRIGCRSSDKKQAAGR